MKVKSYIKVQASAFNSKGIQIGKSLLALNEINIMHQKPQQALRGQIILFDNKKPISFVSDGVLIASAFGSSGYFQSCTRKKFNKGLAVALVNPVRLWKPKIYSSIKENQKIKVIVNRRHGLLYADNSEEIIKLDVGDFVLSSRSKECAYFIEI